MATGVKPRDDETTLSRTDLEAIQEAMKSKKFREMLAEYCDEVRDPANQALYQKEMTQLEKERGYDVTFINPKGGYVIKTSVAGDRKAFINICSNENIAKPSYSVEKINGQKGMNWKIPYSLIPPREDYDNKKERCVIYDVVFHPDTLRMAEVNERFREIVNKTAFDGLQTTYNIHLDSNNCRFPKSFYKGMATPAVVRKENPAYKTPIDEEDEQLSPEILEKLYPQQNYPKNEKVLVNSNEANSVLQRKIILEKKEFSHRTEKEYTIPKYIIKQQKNVDFQDYTYHRNCKQLTAIPSHLVVEINLPLISSTKDCILDVNEKLLTFVVEKPAKYKLNLTLPYSVDDKCGNAKFDKDKHVLIVTLPVIRNLLDNDNSILSKMDSGVESEENSGSQSEDDISKENLITVLSSETEETNLKTGITENPGTVKEPFLQSGVGYILPAYTHNILDNIIAFTFHVKNTEPDSVVVQNDGNEISIKFTSIGSGFVPVYHAATVVFEENIKFTSVSGEAWDNNVILQLELSGDIPQSFQIGLSKDSLNTEHLEVPQLKIIKDTEQTVELNSDHNEVQSPIIEVTNLGTETNIVVSSNNNKDEEYYNVKENNIVWANTRTDSRAKSILRKPMSMMRSFSESSVGDVASSMDYISSDCIPEESSLKKTVRFNDVIAKQFYRYNSSIEGQKKKNQRKKSKKRNQERRRSESEAEEETNSSIKASKPRLKSALKQRRDSGLADTSDAEVECKNLPSDSELSCDSSCYNDKKGEDMMNANSEESSPFDFVDKNGNRNKKFEPHIWKSKKQVTDVKEKKSPITCDNIKHNSEFYNPEKLNKGQYTEIMFKNDLIFDLDM